MKNNCLINDNEKSQLNYFLCVTLKHLARNSREPNKVFQLENIVHLVNSYKSYSIKVELVLILAYLIDKFNNRTPLSSKFIEELTNLVLGLDELDQDVKSFFLCKIEAYKAQNLNNNKITLNNKGKSFSSRPIVIKNVKKNQQTVTKTIQTIKSKVNNKNSEEADFKFLNLTSVLNRNKKLNSKIELEKLETIEDTIGDDRSMWRNTWDETINLYSIVSNSQTLKANDKDSYLPSKFLGNHYFGDAGAIHSRKLYSFFINRLCAAILVKISRRQQLNDNAIDKLMKCVTDFENFAIVLMKSKDYVEHIVSAIFSRYWDLKALTGPDLAIVFYKAVINIIAEEYVEIGWFYNSTKVRMKSFDQQIINDIIMNEIQQIRLDAVKALYNCAIRDKKILTKERVKQIQDYLLDEKISNESEKRFSELIFKLIDLAESMNEIDVTMIFNAYIKLLDPINSTANIKLILNFLNNQTKDLKRCQQLFTDNIIEKLIELLSPQSIYGINIKEDIMVIINNYLELEVTKMPSESNIKLLINHTLLSNMQESSLINATFISLLFMIDKRNSTLSHSVLSLIISTVGGLNYSSDFNYVNYIIFILGRAIIDKNDLFLQNADDLENISYKLDSDEVINFDEEEKKIFFEKRCETNRHNTSNQIGLLTANIILKSIENKVKLSLKTIDNIILIIHSTNEDDKQTKIVAAKCLYYLSKYMSVQNLDEMRELINSDIYDVSVYMQSTYLHGCCKIAFANDKQLNSVHLENISSLYVYESLRLNSKDFENEINQNLLRTLLYEAKKQEFNDRDLFALFEHILIFNGKYVSQIVEILLVYTRTFTIPNNMVTNLTFLYEFYYFKLDFVDRLRR